MKAQKPPALPEVPPVSLAGARRLCLPQVRRAASNSLMALAFSCALHAAPLVVLGLGWINTHPVSAGEDVIDLEMIIAEDETPGAPVEADEARPDAPTPPAVEAAQAPEKPREDKPEPEEATELRQPDEKPEPDLTPAEQKVISVANTAAPAAASEAHQARQDARYNARVARHLARFKRFPAGVRGARTTGRVVIRFALDGEGRVSDLALVTPSGIAAFDAEALAMIRRAEPFPKGANPGGQGFTIPVSYRLKD